MSLHKEVSFEDDICDHLAQHGWLYRDQHEQTYSRELALLGADVVAWVQATDPEAWQTLVKNHGLLLQGNLPVVVEVSQQILALCRLSHPTAFAPILKDAVNGFANMERRACRFVPPEDVAEVELHPATVEQIETARAHGFLQNPPYRILLRAVLGMQRNHRFILP